MKILRNKKIIISFLLISFLLGSTQVYAATALNSNILNLVKSGFNSIKEYFLQSSDQETNKIGTDSSNDIKQYIDNSSNQVISDLESYKNSEVLRADKEIDSHVSEIKKQLDAVVNDEKNKTKQQITDEINKNVDDIKDNLDKDMEKYIKDLLKHK